MNADKDPSHAASESMADLMLRALALELDASDRYAMFADAMASANNPEVAQLFRTMAEVEGKHAHEIRVQMGWEEAAPPLPNRGFDPAETIDVDDIHYLMHPWHALKLALGAEQRAERLFANIARQATDAGVRAAALHLQAEETEHVALIEAWLLRVPVPAANWAEDPDPPRYDQ